METSNIDGETNLKIRESQPLLHEGCGGDVASALPGAQEVARRARAANLSKLAARMVFPNPSKDIHSFDACMEVATESSGILTVPLTPKQLLLRGSVLRNTGTAWCVVVYTGRESKVMMNSHAVPSKLSNLERTINKCIWIIFAAQIIVCLLAALGAVSVDQVFVDYLEDLFSVDVSNERGFFPYFLSFIVLFNNFLPISLYITVEMVLYGQAYFMENDIEMYDAVSDTLAKVRTSNLNGDFGQVDYIFSDKTGTLTQNIMKLKQCYVNGRVYGGADAPYDGSRPPPKESGFKDDRFRDDMMSSSSSNRKHAKALEDFCRSLALCHTVVVERDDEGRSSSSSSSSSSSAPAPAVKYQAESPDEGALVHGARGLGFTLHDRSARAIVIRSPRDALLHYEVLAVNEFNSARKRMSILVRHPDNTIVLYCKGADNIMLELLSRKELASKNTKDMVDHLRNFASTGLRTLVIASRVVPNAEALKWLKRWQKAKVDIENRESELELAASEIECKLHLVGATAIEDKLQDGVPRDDSYLGQGRH